MSAAIPLVHLWGAPGAGRHTTLSSLAQSSELVIGDRDYAIAFRQRHLILRYSSLATKVFYRPDDSSRPPELLPVLDRLVDSLGILFVADSQVPRREHNIGALRRLRADLALRGKNLDQVPVVFLLNKRDLPNLLSEGELVSDLSTGRSAHVSTVARQGAGVADALQLLFDMISDDAVNRPPRTTSEPWR